MKVFVIDRKTKEFVEIKKIDVGQLAKVVDSATELFNKKLKKIKKDEKKPRKILKRSKKTKE